MLRHGPPPTHTTQLKDWSYQPVDSKGLLKGLVLKNCELVKSYIEKTDVSLKEL